jgi:NAD-dependent dihydropyrimidine dehydrogenase PreA subunit
VAIDHARQTGRVTDEQLEAIQETMRIIAEDDESRGVDPAACFDCARCRRARPLIGSVDYAGVRMCNGCATRFEVARLSGRAKTGAQYAGRAPTPLS